ncbi:MAG: hypothetical protein IT204_16235 [Fimbriimonadaceae bacterium]|nr:hypothetical protein [Fimbriimonadaceae bacterium]
MDAATIQDLIRRLDCPEKAVRSEAAELLAKAGDPVVPHLAALMLPADHDADLAHYGVWILEQLESPAAEAVLAEFWELYG